MVNGMSRPVILTHNPAPFKTKPYFNDPLNGGLFKSPQPQKPCVIWVGTRLGWV